MDGAHLAGSGAGGSGAGSSGGGRRRRRRRRSDESRGSYYSSAAYTAEAPAAAAGGGCSGDEYEDAYLYSYYYGGEPAPAEPAPRTGSTEAWELLGKLSSTLDDFRQAAADSPRDG